MGFTRDDGRTNAHLDGNVNMTLGIVTTMRSGLQCSFVSIACHGQRAGLPVISQPTLVNLAMHDYYLRLYWKTIIISGL